MTELSTKMREETENKEITDANAFLRERFLYFLSSICGKKECTFEMYENTVVRGTIKAVDLDFLNIIVENLKTPMSEPISTGILRPSDVLTISYK
ncbi:unnamed protein product [Acanthoscelides obtectus]|uniref:Uncharacterized protein n=1 Tax=Acanthoscelides obtectus TaxID=200917 RepID=A0A9P0KD88_ACAOB|nr:unnamed protein product [Acanthoscelides obtectus]CAK1664210.1 Gem-associated protein 7 [Acanthoscelides obtectus]